MNLVSMSEVMLFNTPYNLKTCLKNKIEIFVASLVLSHGMKCSVFENMSTTMNMESFLYYVFSKQNKIHTKVFPWNGWH